MKRMLKWYYGIIICLLQTMNVYAASDPIQLIPAYNMQAYVNDIQHLYFTVPASHSQNVIDRIKADSAYFLGKPYLNVALGEGPSGAFDQGPLYRTDAFDCLTYVSTVLALAKADDSTDFEKNIKNINYQNGEVSFTQRNHFIQIDWNQSNAKNGYLKDITEQIFDAQGKKLAVISKTLIDKPHWYTNLSGRIKLLKPISAKQAQALLQALHAKAKTMHIEESCVPYIPLAALFDANKNPNLAVFKQIPDGSIIEIVRPNWDLTKTIGTHLDISHLGFAIYTPKGLMFRNASSLQGQVADVLLVDYLKQYLDSSTIKGINIQAVIL